MRRILGLVLTLTTACGDDGGITVGPDGPPVGSDADQPIEVQLTITTELGPLAGIKVYFHAPDSSLTSSVTTDATGVARSMLPAGGSVTVLNPFEVPEAFGFNDELVTFAGVKPGDQLVLAKPRTGGESFTMTITAPLDPDASSYFVHSGCGSGSLSTAMATLPTGQITFQDCTITDLLITTADAGNAEHSALLALNVPVTSGGTVDLSTETYAPSIAVPLTVTSIPPFVQSVGIQRTLSTSRGDLTNRHTFLDLVDQQATGSVVVPQTDGVITLDATTLYATIGEHHVIDWTTGPSTQPHAADLAGVLLKSYTTSPSFDPTTRSIIWSTDATGVTPDFAITQFLISRGGSDPRNFTWRIVAPYDGPSITPPTLAEELVPFNLLSSDAPSISELTTAKVPGGYDAARASVFQGRQTKDLAVGPTGRVVLELLPTAKL